MEFSLNGQRVGVEVAPHVTLLEMLRERLGVKSAKSGCDRGDCGTCTVMIDGRAVRSCLVLAVEVAGQEVTTLEGLMREGLTPLQRAFLSHNSFQCGFCAPGMVIAVTELLGHNASPTAEEIKEAIAGNLCRCTGYQGMVDAALATAKRLRGAP